MSQSASARPELQRLRDAAKIAIGGELSRQDNQRWKPHVTIQNGSPVETAPRFHRILKNGFIERAGVATGLADLEYLGGLRKLVKSLGSVSLDNLLKYRH